MKILIVDDEELARTLVKTFLKDLPDIEIVGEAADGFDALKKINDLKPDALILDIQMPKITGLEMLQLIDEPPLVIFSTAYDQHALEAFEKNAIDYLLKPYSKDRFVKAIEKLQAQFALKSSQKPQLSALQKNIIEDKKPDRIVVKNGTKIEIIPLEKIIYVESYGDYVWIHTPDGKFIKQQTMKELETILSDGFLRIHRSNIVNISQIQKLELYEKQSYQLILKNGTRLAVSKSGYHELKESLGW